MTAEHNASHETARTMVRRVTKKTWAMILIATLILFIINKVALLDPRLWHIPISVLFGGILGILNFRWLAVAVERVYLRKGAGPAAAKTAGVIIHFIKLSAIFVVLFMVIKRDLVNILGLVAGLSLFFLAVIWEGFALMKQSSYKERRG